MTDFHTWLLDFGRDRLFRAWFYYPQEEQWDIEANYIFIKEAIELPNKDILLGVQLIFGYNNIVNENPPIEYHNLNNIRLAYYPDDIEHFVEEESE